VVVALGEPSVPVTVCAFTGPTVIMHATTPHATINLICDFILASPPVGTWRLLRQLVMALAGTAGADERNVAASEER
jgi:hypothetical protein